MDCSDCSDKVVTYLFLTSQSICIMGNPGSMRVLSDLYKKNPAAIMKWSADKDAVKRSRDRIDCSNAGWLWVLYKNGMGENYVSLMEAIIEDTNDY